MIYIFLALYFGIPVAIMLNGHLTTGGITFIIFTILLFSITKIKENLEWRENFLWKKIDELEKRIKELEGNER